MKDEMTTNACIDNTFHKNFYLWFHRRDIIKYKASQHKVDEHPNSFVLCKEKTICIAIVFANEDKYQETFYAWYTWKIEYKVPYNLTWISCKNLYINYNSISMTVLKTYVKTNHCTLNWLKLYDILLCFLNYDF